MVYLVTTQIIFPDGRRVFNPAIDTEVYDSYISALRFLVGEYHSMVGEGYFVTRCRPAYRSHYGREMMYKLEFSRGGRTHSYAISRINMNGFH